MTNKRRIPPNLNVLPPTILAIAKIVSMVNLLVLVISMIDIFAAIRNAGKNGGAFNFAGDIALVLLHAGVGLAIVIPLLVAHVLSKAWGAR